MATATQPTNAKVIDSAMYVCVSPVANNNKFWRYERLDACVTEPGKKGVMETGDLRITWGRVGDSGESQLKMYDEKWLAKKIKEKMDWVSIADLLMILLLLILVKNLKKDMQEQFVLIMKLHAKLYLFQQ